MRLFNRLGEGVRRWFRNLAIRDAIESFDGLVRKRAYKAALERSQVALSAFNEQRSADQEVGWATHVLLLTMVGEAADWLGEFELAERHLGESFNILVGHADQQPEYGRLGHRLVSRLTHLGSQHRTSQTEAAIVRHVAAEAVYSHLEQTIQPLPDEVHLAGAGMYTELALTLGDSGALVEGMRAASAAAAIFEKLSERADQIVALKILSDAATSAGEFGVAESAIRDAVRLSENLATSAPTAENLRELSSCLQNLGNLLSTMKRFRDADAVFQDAIGIRRTIASERGGRSRLGYTLANYGVALKEAMRLTEARTVLEEAVDLLELPDEQDSMQAENDRARAIHNLGCVYCDLGRMDAARTQLQRAKRIRIGIVERGVHSELPYVARSSACLGGVFRLQREYDLAAEEFEQALEIQRFLSQGENQFHQVALIETLNHAGNAFADVCRDEMALELYLEALEVATRLVAAGGDQHLELAAMCHHNIALVYGPGGHASKASDHLAEAVGIRESLVKSGRIELRAGWADSLSAYGIVRCRLGALSDGCNMLRQAVTLHEEAGAASSGNRSSLRGSCGWLGQALTWLHEQTGELKHLQEARKWLTAASDLSEADRSMASDQEQRRVWSLGFQTIHNLLLDATAACICQRDCEDVDATELVIVSELARARALSDALGGERRPRNTPIESIEKLDLLKQAMGRLSEFIVVARGATELPALPRFGGPMSADLAFIDFSEALPQLQSELIRVRDEYNLLVREIQRTTDPDFVPELSIERLTIGEVRSALPNNSTAVVHFTVTATQTFVVVLTRSEAKLVRLPSLTPKDLARHSLSWSTLTSQLDELTLASDWELGFDDWIAQFSRAAVAPLTSEVPDGVETLLIVPHRELHAFPFAAGFLDDGATRLADRYEVRMAPSLRLFCVAACRSTPDEGETLVIDTAEELDYREIELAAACRQCSSVRRHSLTSAVEGLNSVSWQASVLHLCGHGEFNRTAPLESRLGSRGNAPLTMRDCFVGLRLPHAPLVVLSACESGVALPDVLDDHVDFPAAFLSAGARCVVSGLWKVRDLPTFLLVNRFYSRWRKGMSVGRALHEAQNWLRGLPDIDGESLDGSASLMVYLDAPEVSDVIPNELIGRKVRREAAAWAALAAQDNRPPFAHPAYWAGMVASGNCE